LIKIVLLQIPESYKCLTVEILTSESTECEVRLWKKSDQTAAVIGFPLVSNGVLNEIREVFGLNKLKLLFTLLLHGWNAVKKLKSLYIMIQARCAYFYPDIV